jgi:cytochrome c oxidase subunit 4
MTLAQYRKGAPEPEPHGEPAHEAGGHAHPSAMEYIKIGSVLAFITAVEVALYYIDMSHTLLVVLLIILSALKFSLVVLWFMHLRFDNKLFTQLFVGGMVLTFAIFMVALATVGGKLV